MTRSSGKPWTKEEDDRLYEAMRALVQSFEGRSFAAVLSRLLKLAPRWWSQGKR